MCGRFSRFIGSDSIQLRYNPNQFIGEFQPSYNVAPTDIIPIVEQTKHLIVKGITWGYSAQFLETGPVINARSETVNRKSLFSGPIRTRRCLIPATGFYEWKSEKGQKTPYHIRVENSEIFSFGGIILVDENLHTEHAVIMTTNPSKEMIAIHDRMPLILTKSSEISWLDQDTPFNDIMDLMIPFQGSLSVTKVSARVNSPKNNDPSILKAEDPQPGLEDFF